MTFVVLTSNANLAIEFIIKLSKFGGFGRAYTSIEKKTAYGAEPVKRRTVWGCYPDLAD